MNKLFIKKVLLNSYLYPEVVKIEKAIYLTTALVKASDEFRASGFDPNFEYSDPDWAEKREEWDVLYKLNETYCYLEAFSKKQYFITRFPRLYKECIRIYRARLSRVSRLKKRVSKMLTSGQCIFLTFTFCSGALENLSAQTRRDYVRRFLNSLNCPYVGNIDFGAKHGREHYHALVQTDYVCYTNFEYGNLDGTRVRIGANDTDVAKISRYIAKLTNHAIKETTKNSYILYSRKFK